MPDFPILDLGRAEPAHVFAVVRSGPDGDEHLLAVAREGDIAGRMAAPAREIGDDDVRIAARGQVAAAIGKAQHSVGIGDVQPFRLASGRIEGQPERFIEPRCEGLDPIGPGCAFRSAQHPDAPGLRLRDENVAVRREANDPRRIELCRQAFDAKAPGNLRRRRWRPRHDSRAIARRGRSVRRR